MYGINCTLFLASIMMIFSSCNTKNRGEWEVEDVSKDTLFNAETKITDATTLILKINGHSDDSIKVCGIAIPGGDIEKELKVDWYNSKISVPFESYLSKKGSLKIQYYVPATY